MAKKDLFTDIDLLDVNPPEDMELTLDRVEFGQTGESFKMSHLAGIEEAEITVKKEYRLKTNETVIVTDTDAQAFDVYLPRDPADRKQIWFKNSGANTLTIQGNGKDIEGASTKDALTTESYLLYFTNNTWLILASFT